MKNTIRILSIILCAFMLFSCSACNEENSTSSEVSQASDEESSQVSVSPPNVVKLRFEEAEAPLDVAHYYSSNTLIVRDQKAIDDLIDMLNGCEFVEIPKDSKEHSIFDEKEYSYYMNYYCLHSKVRTENGESVLFLLHVSGEYARFGSKEYKIVNLDKDVFAAFSDAVMTWQEYQESPSTQPSE